MRFGKYRHKPLTQIPAGYLQWLLDEAGNLDRYPGLRSAVGAELYRRGHGYAHGSGHAHGNSNGHGNGHHNGDSPTPAGMPAGTITVTEVCQALSTWFRELSKKWHPDRGGSDEAMKAINDAHDRLRQLLGVRE
jgi:hypothetical protein